MKYLILPIIALTPFVSFAESSAAEGAGMSSLVIQLLIIFAIFYFLIIRPQQKKMKEHQDMTKALSKGDKIITQGGIAGVVTAAKEADKFVEVEIATGVKVNVLRSTISEKLSADVKLKTSDVKESKPASKAKANTKSKSKK